VWVRRYRRTMYCYTSHPVSTSIIIGRQCDRRRQVARG